MSSADPSVLDVLLIMSTRTPAGPETPAVRAVRIGSGSMFKRMHFLLDRAVRRNNLITVRDERLTMGSARVAPTPRAAAWSASGGSESRTTGGRKPPMFGRSEIAEAAIDLSLAAEVELLGMCCSPPITKAFVELESAGPDPA